MDVFIKTVAHSITNAEKLILVILVKQVLWLLTQNYWIFPTALPVVAPKMENLKEGEEEPAVFWVLQKR